MKKQTLSKSVESEQESTEQELVAVPKADLKYLLDVLKTAITDLVWDPNANSDPRIQKGGVVLARTLSLLSAKDMVYLKGSGPRFLPCETVNSSLIHLRVLDGKPQGKPLCAVENMAWSPDWWRGLNYLNCDCGRCRQAYTHLTGDSPSWDAKHSSER